MCIRDVMRSNITFMGVSVTKHQGRFSRSEGFMSARMPTELTLSFLKLVLLASSYTKSPQFWQFPNANCSFV
jgi:hypothetical protein